MVCKKLASLKFNRSIRSTLTDSVAVLLQCSSMIELEYQFENVLILLLDPNLTQEVKEAIKNLTSNTYMKVDQLENEAQKDYESDEDDEKVRGEYDTSPFFLHFFKIYNKVTTDIEDRRDKCNSAINQYKSEEFGKYILKRLMPFVPLWTDILTAGRYSNSNAESWFKILKKEVLNGQTNLKVGRFVAQTRSRIKTELKSVRLKIGRTPKCHGKEDPEIDNPQIEEKWKKRVGRKGFLYRKNLKTLNNILGHDSPESKQEEVGENNDLIVNKDHADDTKIDRSILLEDSDGEDINSEKSKKSENMEDRPDERALENGLFFANEYYMTSAMNFQFCLGLYRYELTEQTLTLSSTDYKSLISTFNSCDWIREGADRWLTDYCIDAVAFSKTRHTSHIYYIDTVSTHILFSGIPKNFKKFAPLVTPLTTVRFVLMPYNDNGQHWVLIVLDLKEHTIYILNPSDTYTLKVEDIMQRIKRYFGIRDRYNKEEKLSWRKWKLSDTLYPKQKPTDNINCGIYVIYYISAVSGINDTDDFKIRNVAFDPERYRIALQNILLSSSENVFQKCLICGTATESEYVECSICHRWLHLRNCSEIDHSVPLSFVRQEDFNFKCQCCLAYGDDPFKNQKHLKNIDFNI